MFTDLTRGKHLLLDNHVVADRYRLQRRVHQPRRDAEPILQPPCEWEKTGPRLVSAMYDDERACFRMWYAIRDAERVVERQRRNGGMFGDPKPTSVCYAESEDGVHWTKPRLNLYEGGDNNICFQGFSGGQPGTMSIRPDAPGDEKYVLAISDWVAAGRGGTYVAFSADGIHWKFRSEQPAIYGHSDTMNSVVYNPERKVWMLYMRPWHSLDRDWFSNWVGCPGYPTAGRKNTRRRVAYSESSDLEQWSEPQTILLPDELDEDDIYGMTVFRYADYFLGQLERHDDNRNETIDVELVWSRDGFHWTRHPQRPAFIPTGQPGDDDGYMVFPAGAPVVHGDELFVYYSAYDGPHDIAERNLRTFRSRLRVDGFYSLAADRRLAGMLTRPFTLEGNSISINAVTHKGEIRAELVEPYLEDNRGEPEGKRIEGFTIEDCDVFKGDSTNHQLSWRGSSDLSVLIGRRLMLKLVLYHAEIFSLTI